MCSRTGSSIRRASSGSRSASSSIELLRSAKRTVTCLRSPSRALFEVRIFSARCLGVYALGELKLSCPAVGPPTALPHSRQNLAPAGSSVPHWLHPSASRVPHSRQNFACGGFSCWPRGHFMLGLRIAARLGRFARRREDRARSAPWSTSLTWVCHFWKCDHSGRSH